MEEHHTSNSNNEFKNHIANLKYIKLHSETYCLTQLKDDLEWLHKTITFSKAFSEYSTYVNKEKYSFGLSCPLEAIDCETFNISEKSPFLKYKEEIKHKYKNIIQVFKHLYANALTLPDADVIMKTIVAVFKIDNEVHIKHPYFIMDHYIYHTYCNNHIKDNYEKVLNAIKVYEYLYYKMTNYLDELEFDENNPLQN